MAGMPESAKGIINWVLVVGIVAFVLLLFGIIFGNLQGNVGFGQDSASVTNNTITLDESGITFDDATNRVNPGLTSITIINATGGETISSGNYTISGATITGSGDAPYNGTSVNVSATLSYDSQGLIDTNSIILNYTQSGTNTAAQLPTVGTIIGIVLLIIVLLAALIFVILKLMGIADGKNGSAEFNGTSSGFGVSNGKF